MLLVMNGAPGFLLDSVFLTPVTCIRQETFVGAQGSVYLPD